MAKSEGSRWVERGTGAGGACGVKGWNGECKQIGWGTRVDERGGKSKGKGTARRSGMDGESRL
ncbi:hypothetical protein HMPREF9136_1346 [Prevotella dentalis DSM 3688]|uniref:Uncharacterized protein n=1 Tax=Prevotella dentalis (strain ATCC 49559 / DSM 3688 / JCM 13448 / NCTC 12043 / ES 2772) TaxID=908937 RepID=F9D3B8_PREDD|nr:hypothetical protein HMPREF9136_1346 [Prevotella dentalis DSM 3688]